MLASTHTVAPGESTVAYREEDLDLLRGQVEASHAILPNLLSRPLASLCNLH